MFLSFPPFGLQVNEGLDIRRQKELGLNLRRKKNSKAVEELVDTEVIISKRESLDGVHI